MKVTYYGHACFTVQAGGKTILFDPFIRSNPKAVDIDMSAIRPDYILISHGHWDHCADAEEIARQSGAMIVSNFEIGTWFQKKGLQNIHQMNLGGTYNFEFGSVKLVAARHSSGMPDGSYGGEAGGFIVSTGEGSFYYSGDTALTYDFKLIAERFNLDFALLPIGDNFTMGIDDAIICADFINCSRIIGLHFDTFPPIRINHDDARQRFSMAGKDLILMAIGEEMDIKPAGIGVAESEELITRE